MLCVWWNIDGPVHWELLPRGSTINAALYCDQLRRVAAVLKAKYPDLNYPVVFLHDNARPHVAQATKTVLGELGWDVLPHPPYSPDLAPSDFHLFLSLSSALSGISFNDEAELENWLRQWFASKDRAFYRRGIGKLVERWTEVVNNGGEYIGT
uniref:Transposase n=1 Tax=Acrobeloides nanus TaxID=290746 RepID=A0A914BZG8_9BILA